MVNLVSNFLGWLTVSGTAHQSNATNVYNTNQSVVVNLEEISSGVQDTSSNSSGKQSSETIQLWLNQICIKPDEMDSLGIQELTPISGYLADKE